jgi:hypothetical protein
MTTQATPTSMGKFHWCAVLNAAVICHLYRWKNLKIEVLGSYRATGRSIRQTGLPEMNKKSTSYGCNKQKHNMTLNTNEAKILQYTTTTLSDTPSTNMKFLLLQGTSEIPNLFLKLNIPEPR